MSQSLVHGDEIWVRWYISMAKCKTAVTITVASQITSLTIVYSTVYSGADQIKRQSSARIPTEMASNAENVSIWWRHHDSGTLAVDLLQSCTKPTIYSTQNTHCVPFWIWYFPMQLCIHISVRDSNFMEFASKGTILNVRLVPNAITGVARMNQLTDSYMCQQSCLRVLTKWILLFRRLICA